MIKSYAHALKGNNYEDKKDTEENLVCTTNNIIRDSFLVRKPIDHLPSDEIFSYFLAKAMELQISHTMPDWKTVSLKAINILEDNTINIKDTLNKLNMKIITNCIRNDGNCMYDSIHVGVTNSMRKTLNATIIQEMEKHLVDNPVSFLLHLIIGLKPDNLFYNLFYQLILIGIVISNQMIPLIIIILMIETK